jgi:hypothetical protein
MDQWKEYPHATIDHLVLRSGLVMGEGESGMLRMAVNVGPGSTLVMDDIVTSVDLSLDDSLGTHEKGKRGTVVRLVQKKIREPFPDTPPWQQQLRKIRDMNARRTRRTKGLNGKQYRMDQIPWFTERVPDFDSEPRTLSGPGLMWLGSNGRVGLGFGLANPYGPGPGYFGNWKVNHPKPEHRSLNAFYDVSGHLQNWLILPNGVTGVFPQESGDIYLVFNSSGYIEHWVPSRP